MPKDFDFHMPVIDVMFKLTYLLANTTAAGNKLHSCEIGLTHFFSKNWKICQFIKYLTH